jgi:stearoyl-CoA desaturase (delta-9 desaturase)
MLLSTGLERNEAASSYQMDWSRAGMLAAMHLGCLGVLWTGASAAAVAAATSLYFLRALALTAFYHRYFAHRAFKTSRWFQFVGALVGCLALQKGPLWWAAHHRRHHLHSDQPGDVHSPHQHGFIWSHLGWFLTTENRRLQRASVRDWMKYPELVWLDRNSRWVGIAYLISTYGLGETLRFAAPEAQTDGLQMVVWCFFLSTVALYHVTYSVNSLAHLFGSRRYPTPDHSRNNWLVAVLALGEGWHNNHHHYPNSARQGFAWWEVDVAYYCLWAWSQVGLVWDLRPAPTISTR